MCTGVFSASPFVQRARATIPIFESITNKEVFKAHFRTAARSAVSRHITWVEATRKRMMDQQGVHPARRQRELLSDAA